MKHPIASSFTQLKYTVTLQYHWQELTQVSFLLTNTFCDEKYLSQQT